MRVPVKVVLWETLILSFMTGAFTRLISICFYEFAALFS